MSAGRAAGTSAGGRAAAELLWPVVVAILVVATGFAAAGLYSLKRDDGTGGIPSSIGGLRLTATQTGAAAIAEMSAMHQSDIRIRGGWVARYEGGAVVYVGEAASNGDADLLVRQMTKRIIESASAMFTHEGQEVVAGTDVHLVTSANQRHYYYARGRDVIWIAGPVGVEPGGFLDDALSRLS